MNLIIYSIRLLFLLIPVLTFSQGEIAKGVILDKVTNEPIPYVNISILDSQIGTSSNEDGSYTLNVEEKHLNKSVKMSSLGYESSIIPVSVFLETQEVYLNSLVEKLDEVVISKKFEEKTKVVNVINEEDLCQGYGSHAKNPWILALYFPFEETYETTDYLKSIRFHFGNFRNKKAKFRLRVFSIGKDSLPDKDLLKESVVVSLKKNQKTVDINISEYNVIFPREGFYVAFEWLYIAYNEEKVTYVGGPKNKNKRKGIKHAPTISGICADDGEFMLSIYNAGKWGFYAANKHKSDKKIIPAISLTISN
ncbi:carboxypeptidase-like regulatory domain-containing protein [Winogradskyella eckloniae]|uniref:carboxypeptidase-like regulatory domain-containing protein n=1 Tax=Winogradskyella eckloniae TaxID=1089306 RepID=UPI00156347D4|nr:carboxypeptidase-like regulatory domain-containing protein [Winogradskyella eckloniae]NRD20606.1 carboxypeptidase-like regulatory domain-containing protein [Winogradskyella eckloniae]